MDSRDFRLINAHNAQVTSLALSLDGVRLATASEKGTLIRIFETSNGSKLQELRRGSDPADVYHLAFDRKSFWLAVTSDKNTVHVFTLCDKGEGEARKAARALPGRQRARPPQQQPHAGDAVSLANPGSWFNIAQVPIAQTCLLGDVALLRHLRGCLGLPVVRIQVMLAVAERWVRLQGLLPLPSYFQSEWSFAQFRLPESGKAIVGFHEGDIDECCLFVVTQAGSFYRLRLNATDGGAMQQELYESFADANMPEA